MQNNTSTQVQITMPDLFRGGNCTLSLNDISSVNYAISAFFDEKEPETYMKDLKSMFETSLECDDWAKSVLCNFFHTYSCMEKLVKQLHNYNHAIAQKEVKDGAVN